MIPWHEWWAWAAAGVVFAIAETLTPAYAFLGMAIGAFAVSAAIPVMSMAGFTLPGLPVLILAFALMSFVAWLCLRIFFAPPGRQVKIWRRDINED
ncbi:MAG: hypothetical protein AAF940_13865 [Pseudomonadota bacterium]